MGMVINLSLSMDLYKDIVDDLADKQNIQEWIRTVARKYLKDKGNDNSQLAKTIGHI